MTDANDNAETDGEVDDSKAQSTSILIVMDGAFWKRALRYLTLQYNDNERIAKQIIKRLKFYYIEEQYENVADIISDISGDTYTESIIVQEILEELPFLGTSDDALRKFWSAMRVMYGLAKAPPMQPKNVIWRLDEQLIQQTREYIQAQCRGVIQKGNEDRSLLKIIAVGRKNNIHLLPLLYDCYAKYRIQQTLVLIFILILYLYLYSE